MKSAILVTGVLVLAGAGLSGAPQGQSAAAPKSSTNAAVDANTTLRQTMRKLWTDHVVWTRDYIVASVAGQPDAKAASIRLMRNQDDIGSAIAGYYGKTAGDKLTTLLKEHISIAVEAIDAAKAKNDAGFKDANRRWQENGDAIATFLSQANPQYWPKATLQEMMATHLATTWREVQARLAGNWADDVSAFDAVYDHILKMADALSDGIIKQHPKKPGTVKN